MAAITIRNLPEPVHVWLKQAAHSRAIPVEALRRIVLAEAMRMESSPGSGHLAGSNPSSNGMLETPPSYGDTPKSRVVWKSEDIWAALKGSVHVPDDTDLTAPLLEAWNAEG